MSDKPKIKPSRWWYVAGVLVWIGGCSGTL